MLALLLTLLLVPIEAPKPLAVSAHNCYPPDGQGDARLVEALKLGIDNIEIDLGWDASTGRLMVGHDATPRPGTTYPSFESYIRPLLEAPSRPDGAPTVLTLDWKTDRPEAVARLGAFLDAHAGLFSSALKADPSPMERRRFTVCFTGSEAAKAIYDDSIPPGGTYRAFADTVFGAGAYRDDPSSYSPSRANAYRRFLTFHWGNVEKGAPGRAGAWTEADENRLRAIVAAAHRHGYRVRFYCLNRGGSPFSGYRFGTPEAAEVRWRAAAEAGVDWVASDDYAEIARVLRRS